MNDGVCIIGAGSSGIAACQVLGERGIEHVCFEKGSHIGGNWRYRNDNGQSAAYRSLHINTPRDMMSYRAYPMPEDYPVYPDHFRIARYFDDYADRFGIRERIRFGTEVTSVEPAGDRWRVSWRESESGGEGSEEFAAVVVANGHHWNPRWPEPAFPGADGFAGEQIHAHAYDEPGQVEGRRVLVVGLGNSACDIAVESSRHAAQTLLSVRTGNWVLPKYLLGKPTNDLNGPAASRVPVAMQKRMMTRLVRTIVGDMSDYGLPQPEHMVGEQHPTLSTDLLSRISHGEIETRSNLESFTGGNGVRFIDGREDEIDLVVYCTGYRITFPFLSPQIEDPTDNQIDLYRRVVSVDNPGLYFIGLIQPLGATMPIAELQSKWIADLVEGAAELPPREAMRKAIADQDAAMRRQYTTSKRHTIQVDFHPYLRELERERRERRITQRA